MPPSYHAEFPGYPSRCRWNLVVARSSSGKDMAVHMGPDGCSSSGIVHSPSLRVKKRPIPHVPACCSHPTQVPWLAPATSWAYCTLEPSRPPTSVTLLLGVQGRVPPCSPPPNSQLILTEVGDFWHQFWWLLQVKILRGHHLSPILRTPSRRVVLKVEDMAIPQWHLVVPPLSSPRPMSVAVPAARMGSCF